MSRSNKDNLNKTVAILGSYPPIRGISPYCAELSNALSCCIKKIYFISFKKIYPSFLYPDGSNQTDDSTSVNTAPNLLVRRNLCWFSPLSWIKESLLKFDILHVQWWSLPLFPIYMAIMSIAKIRRKKVIITIHNVIPHESGIISSIVYKFFTSLLFRAADHFIVHTNINKNQLISYFQIKKSLITVIPHGTIGLYADNSNINISLKAVPQERTINISASANTVNITTSVEDLKKQFNIADNCKIILMFGAVRDYKGIDIAVKALSKICIKECHLIIAGKAWISLEKYKCLIKEFELEKNITWLTDYIPSDQVASLFKIADIVILPYKHFDAQSGVAGVAASFSKPMIVSDTGGLSDWVIDKRWAVPPNDVNALAEAIKQALKNPALLKKMAEESKQAAELHSWDCIAEKTLELYRLNFFNFLT